MSMETGFLIYTIFGFALGLLGLWAAEQKNKNRDHKDED